MMLQEKQEGYLQELGSLEDEFDQYTWLMQLACQRPGVTKRFYQNWDDAAYRKYMSMFELDEQKQVKQLSEGMKVKYLIALALSHDAKLLIFDEPTSGLDPVAREDLLELFQQLVKDGKRSILFSTHITSDLDKCADDITYIKNGEIIASADKASFIQAFQSLKAPAESKNAKTPSNLRYRPKSSPITALKTPSFTSQMPSLPICSAKNSNRILLSRCGATLQ